MDALPVLIYVTVSVAILYAILWLVVGGLLVGSTERQANLMSFPQQLRAFFCCGHRVDSTAAGRWYESISWRRLRAIDD